MGIEKLISPEELAEKLGYKSHTLACWRTQGRGPRFVKLNNGKVRYRETDVAEWLHESLKQSTVSGLEPVKSVTQV